MKEFKNFLLHQNLSKNTIESYTTAVDIYLKDFEEITKQNLLAFKAVLVDKYKGKTVNLRIQGITMCCLSGSFGTSKSIVLNCSKLIYGCAEPAMELLKLYLPISDCK